MRSPLNKTSVRVRETRETFPSYLPQAPDKNPMFLEKRVYQGSSGRIYPLPFIDRIAEEKVPHAWKAIHLENDYVSILILPELGGRIHVATDKTNGYDFFYRQHVIKPALVGLAGPWISGGVEFNWPQHHRPATFLPVNYSIEKHPDGTVTVWLGDHDPFARLKGMHGITLHPGKSYIEVKVSAYNRTTQVQTFHWWANVAARVHEQYQAFFPQDVHYIADHAKRATSSFPLCDGHYYGVNYAERARHGIPSDEVPAHFIPPHARKNDTGDLVSYPPNDLTWYANIPVPTSYMAMGSKEHFFGGYDHARQAGFVHVANNHIAPGKKMWTWGNQEFGYAWDRNLTDEDGPYIELMAGVYTDNQPDFSFLQPGETKTWSQYWYPIRAIGPAHAANLDAAASLEKTATGFRVGVSATRAFSRLKIQLTSGTFAKTWTVPISPEKPFVATIAAPGKTTANHPALLRVLDSTGMEIITCRRETSPKHTVTAAPATEPPAPADIPSTDELFITGLHLAQYRHATRCPTTYWREALRRDPLDARCNNALGLWHYQRGEFTQAETHYRNAITRLTRRNPNPYDGEAYYNLGILLRHLGRTEEAYAALYKSCWNQAWQAAGYHALAEIDTARGDYATALNHLDRALRVNTDNLRARNLQAIVLRKQGDDAAAKKILTATLVLDPLDWWARHLSGQILTCDTQTKLDLVHDFARAGLFSEALALLEEKFTPDNGTAPLVHYTRGWLLLQLGREKKARQAFASATRQSPDYCFPSRLEEIGVLNAALRINDTDARAHYYLGNLLYDRRRHHEAIIHWEKSARLAPDFSIVWRNLGIGYANILKNPTRARSAYDKAVRANPGDARLLFERDQLWKRLGEKPARRLRVLERLRHLVALRDDLSVELATLHNQTSQPDAALDILLNRKFQPWEGGEGLALGQYVRAHLLLGQHALQNKKPAEARDHFTAALHPPHNLGEVRHPLANTADIHYWLGIAAHALNDTTVARKHWQVAASAEGDFQSMRVCAISELSWFSALALKKLGKAKAADALLKRILARADELETTPAGIDYFATSLPTLLLFEDDLQARRTTTAHFLKAQAAFGLGRTAEARKHLQAVLARDPNHPLACDLLASLKLAHFQ